VLERRRLKQAPTGGSDQLSRAESAAEGCIEPLLSKDVQNSSSSSFFPSNGNVFDYNARVGWENKVHKLSVELYATHAMTCWCGVDL